MKTDASTTEVKKKGKIRNYFSSLFDIRSDMMDNDELHEMMNENTIISGSNMWILIMAIFIASIGLNVNSTAVIIGAMLISPLMSGILTMGYSLAAGDLALLRKAFVRFGTQVVISLLTSTVYFWITPLTVPTAEMIARTSPTLWDVLIALFGGIAGGIGNTRKKKGNVIPGVAIATALMPPLCTTGYGIATLQPRFILGAFYLFAINTLFIMLSAALVTKLMRVPVHTEVDTRKQKKIHRLITVITIITIVPSVLLGGFQVYQTVKKQNVYNYIDKEFLFPDTTVVQSDMDLFERSVSVSLVGTQISDEVIDLLERELPQYGLEGYTLQVTQNKTIENDDSEKVTIAVQEQTIRTLQSELEEQQIKLEEQQARIDELTEELTSKVDYKKLAENSERIFTKLTDCVCGVMYDQDGEYIFLTAAAEEPLSEEEEQTVKNWLLTESKFSKAELYIRLPQP